ncbi:hypothetical protein ACFOM8_01925 [Paracoccus angustae]|uniref:Tail assembly chaperone n=1 Tax=Paracoccus angustae TaxID=1671480 RepID=A0ABV7TZJ6_9RHOB
MDIDALKKADADAADGEWVGDLPGLGDIRLRVRPLTHPRVLRAYGRFRRKVAADQMTVDKDGKAIPSPLTDEQEDQVDRDVMLAAVLTGWENVTSGKKPVEFTQERAAELLAVEVFEAGVRTAMYSVTEKQAAAQKALEKN